MGVALPRRVAIRGLIAGMQAVMRATLSSIVDH